VARIVITIEDDIEANTGATITAEFDREVTDRDSLTYAQHLAFVALEAIAEHDETPPKDEDMH
jgi:hypothetical protein